MDRKRQATLDKAFSSMNSHYIVCESVASNDASRLVSTMRETATITISIVIIFLVFLSGCKTTDPRLAGKWRSNLELTTQYNNKNANLSDRQKEALYQLFGKMEISYFANGSFEVYLPRNVVITGERTKTFDESREISKYKVLYANDKAVVTVGEDSSGVEKVHVLHFTNDNTYWVYLGGGDLVDLNIREYFTKIE